MTLHIREQKQHLPGPVHARLHSAATALSDADLLGRVIFLAGAEREATVDLVAHLAELDARRLYLGQGYGSLFAYCTGALRLGDYAAYNRIEVARASREFPAILDLLVDGSLNLATARLLAPHLRPDNFEAVVALARGKSKRDVEVLVAGLAPRSDVPSSVRRLPVPVASVALAPVTNSSRAQPTTTARGPDAGAPMLPAYPREAAVGRPADRPVVAPLAPARYRVQFTVGEETHEKLRRVQDLLRREIPDGDLGAIFDRALTLLLEDIGRKKLAGTTRPRPAATRATPSGGMPTTTSRSVPATTSLAVPATASRTPPATASRTVPARVKRAVWARDAGQCAFVGANGRRCTERVFLELHHREPHALGGEATDDNITLRCRRHHAYETELAFGPRIEGADLSRGESGLSPSGSGSSSRGAARLRREPAGMRFRC